MSFIKSTIIFVILSLLLCSCEWREGSERWFASTPQSEITSYYTSVCRELGFLIDTSAMAECIQTQINKQKKEHAQAHAKRAENQKIDDMTNLEPGWSFKYTFNQ